MSKNAIISLVTLLSFFLISLPQTASSADLIDYTAYPPFVSQQETPNVLILLDNSGSMNEFAYKDAVVSNSRGVPAESSHWSCWNGSGWAACSCDDIATNGYSGYATDCPDDSYDSSAEYYGYFNPDTKYSYSTTAGGHFYEDASGGWDGGFLNWLTMRRVDVIRKVIVGGKAVNRANPGTAKYLLGAENPDRNQFKQIADASPYTPYVGQRCFYIDSGKINIIASGSCSDYFYTYSSYIDATYNLKIKIGDEEPTGVVQKTWDRIRFGLMYFNNYGNDFEDGYGRDGAYVSDWISGPGSNVNLVVSVENTDPSTWTPLGESLYEATRFFRAGSGAYQNTNYAAHDPIDSKCQKNFVLILTDGESTKDRNIPGGYWGSTVSDPDGFDVKTYMDMIAENEGYSSQWDLNANSMDGTYYLESVAYWAHTNDLRSDWDDTQNITTYTVFAFDESSVGKDLLQKAAKYGGFTDYNGNNKPDLSSEWDQDGDNVPDTYFEAQEGSALEATLVQALTDILRRASSGTAVSVLATTGEGDGAVYQAYFFPEKLEDVEPRKWLGYIHALFVDKYGNLREDSDGDNALDLKKDYIIEMEYSADTGTLVNKYIDNDENGKKDFDSPSEIVSLENVNSIWQGGKELWKTNPSERNIFTTVDGYTKIDFKALNSSTLLPYLRAADATEADNIIEWVRGDDLTDLTDSGHPDGYRKRSITIGAETNIWKLGDIINSTPTVVARPSENYDLLYGDLTYTGFRSDNLNRRQVVYVGANDGMLHAFNAGCFDAAHTRYNEALCNDGATYDLGKELWAFIPRGLLPHLKWNTRIDYTHVYYVDLKPKVTDVKIFAADSTHSGGWGTILIGGFRYGGKDISWTSGLTNYSASPEYFAIDITKPLEPRLLWTFSDSDFNPGGIGLGLTMSYPSVAKIGDSWFAIFGSGATGYDTSSNLTGFQEGNIFVLKISGVTDGVIDTWTEGSNFWKKATGNSNVFMADPITVDVDLDYDADVIYIGENYQQGSNWDASMQRLTTNRGSQSSPDDWTPSAIGNISSIAGNNDAAKRITSSPSAAMDGRANLWVFFGTGQFYGSLDKNQTDSGGFYAIKDRCWDGSCATSYTNLMDVSGVSVNTNSSVEGTSCGTCSWSDFLMASYSYDGWAMYFGSSSIESNDFTGQTLYHSGERVFAKPLVLGGLVMWTSYIPGVDACSFEGESNIYAVYYNTGTAYRKYVFKEQKDAAHTVDEGGSTTYDIDNIARVKKLGKGMPSSLSGQITSDGTMKGFAQQSTGSILEIENITPIPVRSSIAGWKSEQIE